MHPGHIACTQGGECLAGLVEALAQKLISSDETAILDETAHAIKFSEFQDLYFKSEIPQDYHIKTEPELVNMPSLIMPDEQNLVPSQHKRLNEQDFQKFVVNMGEKIAESLELEKTC